MPRTGRSARKPRTPASKPPRRPRARGAENPPPKPPGRRTGTAKATATARSNAAGAGKVGRPPARASDKPRVGRWLFRSLYWLAVAGIWGLVGLAALVAYYAWDLPPIDPGAMGDRRPSVTVLASDGAALARLGDQVGETLTVADLPAHLVHAVLAIEDRRFYSHPGLDPIGIVRAAWANVQAGRAVQGGSTITQQLVKNLFLTPERTLRRKAQEAILAVWLEARFDKDTILSAYLNRAYFGAGAYGVDAAARTYFGVSARSVSLEQAATLAGLLRAPSRLSPLRSPAAAQARAQTVLAAMADAGFLPEGRQARPTGPIIPPRPRRRPAGDIGARYFADWIASDIGQQVGRSDRDLIATSTLDPAAQRIAQDAVQAVLQGRPDLEAAVVVMRPDGAIRAMVGGRDYADSQFNRATQAQRQPGSAWKPILYAAALEAGYHPSSRLDDTPIRIGTWQPENAGGRYRGEVSLTEALAQSSNAATVRLLQSVGLPAVRRLSADLGIDASGSHDLTMALGTGSVRLIDLTAGYAALANGGHPVMAYGVRMVEGADGAILFDRRAGTLPRLFDPHTVTGMHEMLAAVITQGTGQAARLDDRPVAGKTGTSQDNRDAWFIGYTADNVIGVWVGRDDAAPADGISGGGIAATLWHRIAEPLHRGLPVRAPPGWNRPDRPNDEDAAFLALLRRVLSP